jgi:hypothetical protein
MFNNKKSFHDIFSFLLKKKFSQNSNLIEHTKKHPSSANNKIPVVDLNNQNKKKALHSTNKKEKKEKRYFRISLWS